jgi:hypothetical protein
VTWATTCRTTEGEVVGRPLFRILEFDPSKIDLSKLQVPR